jgi:predicted TIM-barrel fold metal-dependent hydrolase
MAALIDWHAHHAAPELAERIGKATGRTPRADEQDSPDFATRIAEMDEAGIDVQLISPGQGLNGAGLEAEEAMDLVRASNDLIAKRIEPYPDRFIGNIVVTFKDPEGSVGEIDRMVERGFRAVIMYAQGSMVGQPANEPIFAKIAERGLPIFLHGGGRSGSRDTSLDALEDGGQAVSASAHADGAVSDFVVRTIAAGLFDRYPQLQFVIRSGGGSVPLLLGKLYHLHKGPGGEQRYRDVLLDHYLVDTASVRSHTLRFLIDQMGEERVVFGSDYCGGLGPLVRSRPVIDEQPEPERIMSLTERNSRRLLGL